MYEFAVTPAVTQLRRAGVTIESVEADSLAEELDLAAGDRIVRVNGRTVRDYLDFRFQTSGETHRFPQLPSPILWIRSFFAPNPLAAQARNERDCRRL